MMEAWLVGARNTAPGADNILAVLLTVARFVRLAVPESLIVNGNNTLQCKVDSRQNQELYLKQMQFVKYKRSRSDKDICQLQVISNLLCGTFERI